MDFVIICLQLNSVLLWGKTKPEANQDKLSKEELDATTKEMIKAKEEMIKAKKEMEKAKNELEKAKSSKTQKS